MEKGESGIAKLRMANLERSYYTRNNLDTLIPSLLNKAKFISRIQRNVKESIYKKIQHKLNILNIYIY